MEGGYAPALARLVCLEGAEEPRFEKARRHLAETGGIDVSGRQIQRLLQRVGSSAQAWRQRQGASESTDAPILSVTAHGTGIPRRKESLKGRKGRQPDGSAKMARADLGCVFTRHRRDSQGHLVRDDEPSPDDSSLESVGRFGPMLRGEALRGGAGAARGVVLLVDGAPGLKPMGRDCFKDAVQMADFLHAMEHAGRVLGALLGKDHPDHRRRLRQGARRLLRNGGANRVEHSRREALGTPREAEGLRGGGSRLQECRRGAL